MEPIEDALMAVYRDMQRTGRFTATRAREREQKRA
jgi:ribosomal protein S21